MSILAYRHTDYVRRREFLPFGSFSDIFSGMKPRDSNSIQVPHKSGRTQLLEPSLDAALSCIVRKLDPVSKPNLSDVRLRHIH